MAGECSGRPPAAGPRPAGKLSLFVGLTESLSSSATAAAEGSSRSPTPRSPRSFDYDGAVGLGIVAAMNDGGSQDAHPRGGAPVTRTPRPAAPARSVPIPIVSAAPFMQVVPGRRKEHWRGEEGEMELSESYTCVISHVGGAAVRKRVYFDDGGPSQCWGGFSAVLWETPPPPARPSPSPPPPPPPPPPEDNFLSRCFRCRKKLHGLDIFMYMGEKAFCSVECRCQQIISDERREKRVPDALKSFDCSSDSPCSTPLFFAAGVAAA